MLTGLLAGLFYGYQCSVIKGLAALGNKEYLLAFQSINKEILNPVFFLSFMGSLLLLPVATFLSYRAGTMHVFPFLLTATVVYAIGVFLITVTGNVPSNEALASFDILNASTTQLEEMRQSFESRWNTWHLTRTLASVASFTILIVPLLKKNIKMVSRQNFNEVIKNLMINVKNFTVHQA